MGVIIACSLLGGIIGGCIGRRMHYQDRAHGYLVGTLETATVGLLCGALVGVLMLTYG